MGRKEKFSPEEKILAVRSYLDGKESLSGIANRLNVPPNTVAPWVSKYIAMGPDAFITVKNKRYSKELKEQAVRDYLAGEGSYQSLAQKYKLHSTTQLRQWVKVYNAHGRLTASGTGGHRIMKDGRKTTFEERVEIASYCIAHDHNYAETAEKYKVSYQQARSYTVKYEEGGVDALQDRRGKRKDVDSLSEIERLKAELKLEKAKRIRAEMEVSFLKKLEEIERRRR